MAEAPINLNRARKERARQAAKARADENAVRFGRTRAERERDRTTAEAEARRLDAHRREDPDGE